MRSVKWWPSSARTQNAYADSTRASVLATLAVWLLCWSVVTMLQWKSGALQSELLGYPDEPAHYVTGLMVHEYLHDGFPGSPLTFARNYYIHYPEVAIGHWPPFLYALLGAWMLVFSAGRVSVMLFVGCLTGATSAALFATGRRRLGWFAALLCALWFPLLPVVQKFSAMVMAEALLTLLCFLSTLAFARFLRAGRWQDATWYGVLGALAILTKGSGWLLLLVPPMAALLTHKLPLLWTRAFWSGPAIMVAIAGPWQAVTLKLANQGWNGPPVSLRSFAESTLQLSALLVSNSTGSIVFAIVLIGATVGLARGWRLKEADPEWTVLASLVVAVIAFHATVPAGLEARKIAVAAPAIPLFVAAGLRWLAELSVKPGVRRSVPVFAAVFCAALFAVQAFGLAPKTYSGYTDAARLITAGPRPKHSVILLSTESHEGSLVAELAMRNPKPDRIVLRGSKVLASTNWNGSDNADHYHSAKEIHAFLDAVGVDTLVVENSPPRWKFEYHRLILEMLRDDPGGFVLTDVVPRLQPGIAPGKISIYRRPLSEPEPGVLQARMRLVVKEVLER